MMRVVFMKYWNGFQPGEITVLPQMTAQALVSCGICQEHASLLGNNYESHGDCTPTKNHKHCARHEAGGGDSGSPPGFHRDEVIG